jgi:uncharacterized protein with PIN domain
MEYLKEEGSLDVDRIRKLPHDEKCHVIGRFTREQMEEYFSKCPVCHGPIKPVKVNYKMEDLLAKGWGTIDDIYSILMK